MMYNIYKYVSFFVINKTNLLNNVQKIRNLLNKNVKLCAMVKADAYSHDIEIISTLLKDKVDYFGVAQVKEAIKIRNFGIKTPILCVGSFLYEDIKLASENNVDLTIYNFNSLKMIINAKLKINVHIKIDTGMSRLGLKNIKEFLKVLNKIKQYNYINIVGIFSHFADSDNNKEFTDKQYKNFLEYVSYMHKKTLKHIANTSASKNKKYQMDMVRVGLGLYGYGNIEGLKPVMSLISSVIDIHSLKKGETVGYEGKFKAENACKIATIFLGYADGLDLRLSGAMVKIKDKRYKIVGKICMDMFMLLVDDNVKIGDEVIIFENASELAHYSKKSIYAFLSNINHRRCNIKLIN